jgi:hypothetical protein
MRGLLVVGVVHRAGEDEVAHALGGALGVPAVTALAFGSREAHAVHAFPALASPVTASRHVGSPIDPAGLAGSLRQEEEAVIAAGGGLLAPITPRYSIRNLAADLGLPLVLAAPAGPDAVNLVRLSAEAARGAGLAVAAAVLTGWPDPPDRVLLDERRLLSEIVSFPVVTLPAAAGARAEAVRGWGATGWLEAAPAAAPPPPAAVHAATAPAPAAHSRAEVTLEPYDEWEATPVGDPRATPRPRIMDVMLEIAGAEGPLRATRAYSLYNRASGGKKLTTIARAPLSSAVYWLAQERRVVLTKRDEIPWQDDDLIRLPDTPAVRVRELGPRTLEEVPLDEIAELMRRLRASGAGSSDADLKRAVLSAYGLVRLTTRADEYLGLAIGLLGD